MKGSSSLLKGSYNVFPNFFVVVVSILYEFSRVDKDLYMVNLGLLMYASEYTQKAQTWDPVNKPKSL